MVCLECGGVSENHELFTVLAVSLIGSPYRLVRKTKPYVGVGVEAVDSVLRRLDERGWALLGPEKAGEAGGTKGYTQAVQGLFAKKSFTSSSSSAHERVIGSLKEALEEYTSSELVCQTEGWRYVII
jgi:hypothetical protein